jgi:hypothetical protein
MTIEGCIHLLQEKEPTKLVGSMAAWVEESGKGWINLSIGKHLESATVTLKKREVILAFSFEMALSIASLLLCLVNQNKAIRVMNGINELKIVEYSGVKISYQQLQVEVIIELGDCGVNVKECDDEFVIDFVEDAAEIISMSLFEKLGECTAVLAAEMTRLNK